MKVHALDNQQTREYYKKECGRRGEMNPDDFSKSLQMVAESNRGCLCDPGGWSGAGCIAPALARLDRADLTGLVLGCTEAKFCK